LNKKWLFVLLIGYSVAVAVSCVFPVGLNDTEWYSFYSYLDQHGAAPYIDVREGYPPLGFLAYMPLYYAFRGNALAFSYGFRALNGTFLIATLFTFYLIMKALYDEEEALKRSLYYAVLPSVIIANTYSNDVIALLPAALAVYMIVKKKPIHCGILLGLATLSKGFPALLLIPAVIAFTGARNRLKLIGTTLCVLVFVSLPFALINPFTYLSTFTSTASRGPWETIWAIADGYYSHGGLLHPYFDKFFYHSNLLQIYSASSYDHAIYEWNFNQISNILTFCQVAIIVVISLAYLGRKKQVIPLCGLLYISYMLFFKGYSTQFSVFTSFYVLLATATTGVPLLLLIPLELSHIMQMLAWNSQAFAPEFLRNVHLPMLVSAVILRTIVFISLIATALLGSHFSFKPVMSLARRFGSYLKLIKDKWLVLAISAMMVTALISAASLYGYVNDPAGFRSYRGSISVTQSEWQTLKIDGLEKGDQVMIKLTTHTWLDAKVANSTVQVERGVRNPYSLKDSFNETTMFFIADAESCSLMLRMKHSEMPFRVSEGLEKDLNVDITSEDSALTLKLQDTGADVNVSILTMAYPISTRVDYNFNMHLSYKVVEGNLSDILIYVFDDTDEWLYSFAASEDFVLTSETRDVYGNANLLNDNISLVEVTMTLEDNASAIIRLDELSVSGEADYNVEFYAYLNEEIAYEVFIERDFKPSISYAAALIATVALGAVAIGYLYKKVKRAQGSHLETQV
jgi:hypothetical protein